MSENLTVTVHKAKDLRIDETSIPEPKDDEVLIKMDSVGICGSDVHFWQDGGFGELIVKTPTAMGHEGAGIVHRIGKNVTTLKPGDYVAIEAGVPCRACTHCKTGRYNLCPTRKFCSTPPVHGFMRQYHCHVEDFCYKLPDTMSLEEGALIEPLNVAVYACRRGDVRYGKTVLVCGAGPIGLLNMMVAKAMGATEVVITDINPARLEIAKSLGADSTYQINRGTTPEDAAEEIAKLYMNNRKPDIVLECSGAEASVRTGIFAAHHGGVLVCIGIGPNDVKVPLVIAGMHEVDIKGIYCYANCYPTAISLVASGRINVKPLVTHRFKLKEAFKAFETCKNQADGCIKVMIKCAQ